MIVGIGDNGYNSLGSLSTMGQPTNIEDKANNPLSPSIFTAGQLKQPVGTPNQVEYFDSSKGGSGKVVGETARIRFIRSDDRTKFFTIQKRAATTLNTSNVLEVFASTPARNSGNYIFMGRDGTNLSMNVGYMSVTPNIDTTRSADVFNGTFSLNFSTNGVLNTDANMSVADARLYFGSGASGLVALLAGTGTNGIAGLGWATGGSVTVPIYVDSVGLRLGGSIFPDGSGYSIGNSTHKLTFYGTLVACPLPITDNALDKLSSDFKKLPEGVGHFGDDISYLDIPDAPEGMKKLLPDGTTDIEIVKTVGFLYSCVVELTKKVKELEQKSSTK